MTSIGRPFAKVLEFNGIYYIWSLALFLFHLLIIMQWSQFNKLKRLERDYVYGVNASCFKSKAVRAVITRWFYIEIEKCYIAFKLVYYLNASVCN